MEGEKVIEKIVSDARAEAQKIKNQADETRNAEQAKLDEQLKEFKKQTDALARKAGEEEKAHILAAAKMDIAKQLLAEKRKILDEVFGQARQQLENLSDEQYLKLMTKLMLEVVETGDEEVITDNNEKRIGQKFIDGVNQKLAPSRKGNLKLSQERAGLGMGFILKRGKIKNNVSIGVLLARAREQLEIELAKELFGD
ncbi:MAG: V-type ATP synthase subunit E [Sedimentisphaerales bacterium]|nr:V-type ATP synthase subunit E [Sedimentisphaerales bacterium]